MSNAKASGRFNVTTLAVETTEVSQAAKGAPAQGKPDRFQVTKVIAAESAGTVQPTTDMKGRFEVTQVTEVTETRTVDSKTTSLGRFDVKHVVVDHDAPASKKPLGQHASTAGRFNVTTVPVGDEALRAATATAATDTTTVGRFEIKKVALGDVVDEALGSSNPLSRTASGPGRFAVVKIPVEGSDMNQPGPPTHGSKLAESGAGRFDVKSIPVEDATSTQPAGVQESLSSAKDSVPSRFAVQTVPISTESRSSSAEPESQPGDKAGQAGNPTSRFAVQTVPVATNGQSSIAKPETAEVGRFNVTALPVAGETGASTASGPVTTSISGEKKFEVTKIPVEAHAQPVAEVSESNLTAGREVLL